MASFRAENSFRIQAKRSASVRCSAGKGPIPAFVVSGVFTRHFPHQDGGRHARVQRLGALEVGIGDPQFGLVVLDEMTYAFKYGWLDLPDVLDVLVGRPPMQHVIITGRAAPEALVAAADTVTDMSMVRHAFKAGVKAMPGMEW